jgi:HKD family nuclease
MVKIIDKLSNLEDWLITSGVMVKIINNNFNDVCLLQKLKCHKNINCKIYHYIGLYQKL